MSFYASMTDSSFYVATENTGRVLAKLQKQPHRFDLDSDGNITAVDFSGYLTGNEQVVFAEIAPFIKDESYIRMHGEDGTCWMWRFVSGRCKRIDSSIVWEE